MFLRGRSTIGLSASLANRSTLLIVCFWVEAGEMTSAGVFFWGVNSKSVLSWLMESRGFCFWEEDRNLSS